jgi:hypothetical protein
VGWGGKYETPTKSTNHAKRNEERMRAGHLLEKQSGQGMRESPACAYSSTVGLRRPRRQRRPPSRQAAARAAAAADTRNQAQRSAARAALLCWETRSPQHKATPAGHGATANTTTTPHHHQNTTTTTTTNATESGGESTQIVDDTNVIFVGLTSDAHGHHGVFVYGHHGFDGHKPVPPKEHPELGRLHVLDGGLE